jgi:hypothetical protein
MVIRYRLLKIKQALALRFGFKYKKEAKPAVQGLALYFYNLLRNK